VVIFDIVIARFFSFIYEEYSMSIDNPAGTDGFEFMEFASDNPDKLSALFTHLGFTKIGTHKTKAVDLWQQGDIHFLNNYEPSSFGQKFFKDHGPCVSAMAFRVKDARAAYDHCIAKGAKHYDVTDSDWVGDATPVIYGIGDNMLYLIDQYGDNSFYEKMFDIDPDAVARSQKDAHFNALDHVTHNVFLGNMDKWANFYTDLFNFREIRFFDIRGKITGLLSRAMASPCNKIMIPINEPTEGGSQIQEYLDIYKGEGIQHIALHANNIYNTVEALRDIGMQFLDTPDTYFKGVEKRLPGHGEPLERMHKNKILIDGSTDPEVKTLLQIFTETEIGPVFFEIIQRKGDQGFGEGNFQALFDSMEQDQIERGFINADGTPGPNAAEQNA
jgi:4-hydroxyphenylpyruvate dioxygenase